MARLLQAAQLGHPILRKKAQIVKNINDKKIQILIDDMLATLIDSEGMGMAAPQVYKLKQILIVASHPNSRYPNAPKMKPTPMINPKIIAKSKVFEKSWEGCLSIPGIRALVPREKWVKIQYYNRNGKETSQRFEGFIARIFLHEFDHLFGKLFVDRVVDSKDFITEKEYFKLFSKKK